jgi:long-chain fatty acid transport protein
VLPQGNDGSVTVRVESWGWGYNVGALYQFSPETRAGVAYRSRIEHDFEGDARFAGVPAPNPTGRFRDTDAAADATFPDSASLSVWHSFTDDLAATADVTWTHWDTVDELRIRFANPAESDTVISTRWENTWRYALGLVFTPGAWTLRTGAAYDESPVPDAALRIPHIPDNDRIWVAGGIGYQVSKALSLDLAYAHLFVQEPSIHKSASGEDRLRGALSGSYRAAVDIVGAQLAWSF